MNLSDITTKGWILALFVRDDGERLLLGDGWFDFKDSLQHFQADSIANDVVELQGTDGQLLAGQVRRSGAQTFEGYVGDNTISQTEIENRRRQFLQFFQVRRFYKVVYIFPDGTAIDRKRGYLTESATIPEMWQKFPEYHVTLNFENVNYYEYAENADGDEIFANTALVKLSNILSGGLVWDEDGAYSMGIQWSGYQTLSGNLITINDGLAGAPMSLTELNGNATQTGAPTPDSPVAINTVTGEQTIGVAGKNLFDKDSTTFSVSGVSVSPISTGIRTSVTTAGTYRAVIYAPIIKLEVGQTITLSANMTASSNNKPRAVIGVCDANGGNRVNIKSLDADGEIQYTLPVDRASTPYICLSFYGNLNGTGNVGDYVDYTNIQLELGSTATTYEPYQGQEFEVNLGKNLLYQTELPKTQADVLATYNDGVFSLSGTANANSNLYILPYTQAIAHLEAGESLTYYLERVGGTSKAYFVTYFIPDDGSATDYNWQLTMDAGENSKKLVKTATKAGKVAYAQFFINNGVSYDVQVKVLVQKGNIANPTWAEYFAPIELAKIGTYQDRIYKDEGKWYIEKQVGKVVLDGTSDNIYDYAYGTNSFFVSTGGLASSTPTSEVLVSSDHFYGIAYDNRTQEVQFSIYADGGIAGRIDIRNTTWTSVDNFKTWLGTHNTTVYYVLATATDTEITNSALLEQLNVILPLFGGVNNISLVPSGAQGSIKISYATTIKPGQGYVWEQGDSGGATNVNVSGIANALPIWTVTGPAVNPTLTNVTTGQSITWTGTVPNGQKLVIDMDEQTAKLSGANVYANISGQWIELQPGINRLSYIAGGGATESSKLEWNGVVG